MTRHSMCGLVVIALCTAVCLRGPALSADMEQRCTGGCAIELDKVVTLKASPSGTTVFPTDSFWITRYAGGRYIVVSQDLTHLLLFSQSGQFLRRIDGAGGNPFGRITSMLTAPDGTLRVYDVRTGSLYALDAGLKVAGSTPFQYRPSLLLRDGTYIRSQHIPTPELAGYPLHVLSPTGTVVRSFGVDSPEFRADQPSLFDRVVGESSSGRVWSAVPGRYVLELWEPSAGSRLRRLLPKSEGFQEFVRTPSETEKPPSTITSIWEAGRVVWTLSSVADSKWQAPDSPLGDRRLSSAERDRTYDWIIDAVDPSSGGVLATRRFDLGIWARNSSGLLATSSVANGGAAAGIDVWAIRLRGKEGRER